MIAELRRTFSMWLVRLALLVRPATKPSDARFARRVVEIAIDEIAEQCIEYLKGGRA